MTRLKDAGAGGIAAALYGLVAPASGANNVIISWSGAPPGRAMGAESFSGASQSALVADTGLSATGTSTTPTSAAHAITAGDVIIDSITAGQPQTAISPTALGWVDGSGDGQGYRIATAGGSFSTTWSLPGSAAWAISSYALAHS